MTTAVPPGPAPGADPRLPRAVRALEALFVRQLVDEMTRGLPGLDGPGLAQPAGDALRQHLSESLAGRLRLGLAERLLPSAPTAPTAPAAPR